MRPDQKTPKQRLQKPTSSAHTAAHACTAKLQANPSAWIPHFYFKIIGQKKGTADLSVSQKVIGSAG
jgi:hypothetical protein